MHASGTSRLVERRGVRARQGFEGQVPGGDAEERMNPLRGDLSQRRHHKPPLMGAWMRKDQARLVNDDPTVGDQVEIEGARSVGRPPATPETSFKAQQGVHHLARRNGRIDKGDAVEIVRVRPIGPGRRSPPARASRHVEADVGKPQQGRFQQVPT